MMSFPKNLPAKIVDAPNHPYANHMDYITIGFVEDHRGEIWALCASEYITGLKAVTAMYEAFGNRDGYAMMPFGGLDRYTIEHFRRMVAMDFPSPVLVDGGRVLNWSPKRIDQYYEGLQQYEKN